MTRIMGQGSSSSVNGRRGPVSNGTRTISKRSTRMRQSNYRIGDNESEDQGSSTSESESEGVGGASVEVKSRSLRSRASRADPATRSPHRTRGTQSKAQKGQCSSSKIEFSRSDESESSDNSSVDAASAKKNGESEGEPKSRLKAKSTSESQRSQVLRSINYSKDPRSSYYFVEGLDIKYIRRKEMYKRFRYLLSLGDLFYKFLDYKAQKDDDFREILEQAVADNKLAHRISARGSAGKRSRSQKRTGGSRILSNNNDFNDDLDSIDPELEERITVFNESPGFVAGELRQYQIHGLNWLISLFTNNLNGILADEMGLGKTFQCIAFLGYLRCIQQIPGPHLVIAPKSTVQNWAREFEKWTPDVNLLVISGDKEERADLVKSRLMTCQFDICITSFELLIREKNYLKRIAWQYVIVDEAHRLKNEESILSKLMRVLFSRHRLLITGTPLQNNLHELWALLNFLLPDVFSDAEVFDEWFQSNDTNDESKDDNNEKDANYLNNDNGMNNGSTNKTKSPPKSPSNKKITEDQKVEETKGEASNCETDGKDDGVVDQLRMLLSPFLLRRVKRDVEHTLLPKKEINLYVGMTDMQIEWYQRLLEKDLDAVNNVGKGTGTKDKRMRLLNVVMQLRKCCNHPYLFEGAEPGPPFTNDEHIVTNSGKMILLDKLLVKLKKQGSRVLIFSQMSRMLDILEDFCVLRDYEYCRIDGSTQHEDRVASIDEFNRPGSDKFLFLLTTRAGGLGINLTTADQVIIYDSDWNPQADLQAMDRAHRIGQTKQVYVYRMIVEHAIEEKVLERAAHKLRLDQLVIQGSTRNSAQEKAKAAASKEELVDMIRHGAQEVLDNKKSGTSIADMSIDDLIASGEKRTKEMNEKYIGLGLDELIKLTFDKPISNNSPLVNKNAKAGNEDDYRHHHRRARNQAMFSVEPYGRDSERTSKSGVPRAPKQIVLQDFQFFPPELHELQARELAWYRKVAGIRLSSEDYSSDEEDESEKRNLEIEDAKPLTEEELELKEKMINEGFLNFTKRDFYNFLNLVIEFGGFSCIDEEALNKMKEVWSQTSPHDIKRYYKVFFERYTEIADHQKYMNMLEAGENKVKKQNYCIDLLRRKVDCTLQPLSNMRITQPSGGSSSKHRFTEDNDRFLVVAMNKIGLNKPNLSELICDEIRTCGLFDFDWYFMSRTATEIGRRCTSLLNIIAKEDKEAPKGTKRKGRPPGSGAQYDKIKRVREL